MKKWIKSNVYPFLAFLFIYIVSATLRLTEVGKEHETKLKEEKKPVILSFWHGRLFYFPHYYRKSHSGWRILTSASEDGAIIANTLSHFGFGIVRGSSFKDARKALRELKRHIDNGHDVVLIADGSRGPFQTLQPGALMVSKLTGSSALPVTVSFSRYWKMKTWDRLIIPKPFSKVIVMFGEPVRVPEKCGSAQIEEKRKELESKLLEITKTADRYFDSALPNA